MRKRRRRLCAAFNPLDRDRFLVGRLPAPSARAVARLAHALLVGLRDDLGVTGEQRLGRAQFRARRALALGQTVGAVSDDLGLAVVGLRAAGAEGALVHLAA